MECIGPYITKSIGTIVIEKDTGKCKNYCMKAYENLYGSRGSNPMVLLEKNICFTRLIIIQKAYELESW